MDNYYLNNAVYLVEEFLKSTTNPFYAGQVAYGDRAEHCWNGDHNLPNHLSRLRYNIMYLPKILDRIKKTAPAGADEIEHGRADHYSVEIIGEALGGDQTLPSSGRATVEVGSRGGGAVILADDPLRGLRRNVDGAERVIEQLLPVDGECPEWLVGGVVPGD